MYKRKLRNDFRVALGLLRDRWTLAVTGAWSAIIWIVAATTNHVAELLLIFGTFAFALIVAYFTAKGK